MSGITYNRKMTDAEGLMWRLENDPHLSSTFAAISILDRSPDFAQFRQRMERASLVMPRLRQTVRVVPGNLAPPTWVADSNFDLDHHVRRVELPIGSDERVLLDLASLTIAAPFDRSRPLWEFTIVEGLEGGQAALIQKMHHTIADGESGVKLSLEYMDFERDAPARELPNPDHSDGAAERLEDDATEVVRDLLAATLRLPVGVARQVRDLLADPSQIANATSSAAETIRSIVAQLGDTDGARSPLWTERSLERHVETASAPFRPTKDAATALGGTLNTAFMTIAATAVSRYHVELDSPIDELRASMAISTRTDDSGANAFSLVRMLVPTSDMAIDERFMAIHKATDAAVNASKGASLDGLAALAATLPTQVVTRLARQQAQTVDFATSNVKGSPFAMFVAGSRILSNHAIGPLSGVAFNLTLLSYNGHLDMGLNTDPAAVKDPALLRRFLADSIDDFVAFAH
jgi:WS/DGAT/MGAT family acyltransferase